MKTTKIDENTIEVERMETKVEKVRYAYDFLLRERQRIIDQKDKELARMDAELADVELLIAECKKLGMDK